MIPKQIDYLGGMPAAQLVQLLSRMSVEFPSHSHEFGTFEHLGIDHAKLPVSI